MVAKKIDKEKIAREIMLLSREPFQELLGLILGCKPDEDSLTAFAKRQPDRWGQLVAVFGRLAGFSDKVQVDTTIQSKIQAMSDLELLQYHAQIEREYAELMCKQDAEAPPKAGAPPRTNGSDVRE